MLGCTRSKGSKNKHVVFGYARIERMREREREREKRKEKPLGEFPKNQ